ncbi:MAG: AlpA family phage regulatory protein [Proteobacteria bacterium]|nr:AlpA family phage regulatory protein [Pseudomonadota bacterium]
MATAPRILRRPDVTATYGLGRSTIYELAAAGLLPRPVRIGARATGWPAEELEQVFRARVAGADEAAVRALVAELHAARTAGARAA